MGRPQVDQSKADGVPVVELRMRAIEALARGDDMVPTAQALGIHYETLRSLRRREADRIDARRRELEAELLTVLGGGAWIADKAARLQAYQDDVERVDVMLDVTRDATEVATLMARKHAALRAAAEELGQLPPRQLTVSQTIINYTIEGVAAEAI